VSKLNVWGWRADSAGCGAYRVRWVADAVNKHFSDSMEYRNGEVMTKEEQDWADVIVGQRVCLPGSAGLWKKWAQQGEKILVSELDDDLWCVPESNLRGSAIFNSKGYRDRMNETIRLSDYVTVSTEPLRQAVHRNTGFPLERIFVVPNALPPELVLPPEDLEMKSEATLGYLCSPTHSEDFAMVQRHLRRFLENNPEASFHTIGKNYDALLKLPDQTRNTHWIKSPEDAILKIDYGIGICPLVPGVFNQSKSDCKFLEASARGAVTIASDVAPYASVVHGETGYKVRREHEWGRMLQRVYDDPDDALRVLRNAHRYVSEHRTTDQTAALWHEVLSRGKPQLPR